MDLSSELGRKVKNVIDALKADMLVGNKIERDRWPKVYVAKYGIRNLFIARGDRGIRFAYTIVSEGNRKIVIVLECFPDHKSYEARFGYS